MKINPADLLNPQFNTTRLQQLGWQAPDKHLIASSWGDDLDVWKIYAMAGGVSRDERPLLNFSMSADIEIWQWRGFRAAASTVFQKSLRREPPGTLRQRQPLKDCRIKPPVQIAGSCESRCQFRVDDWLIGIGPCAAAVRNWFSDQASQTGSAVAMSSSTFVSKRFTPHPG
jgi:hypothetical protein